MCNGNQNCPWEISNGENWGDCRKPPHGVCPEDFETMAEAVAAANEYEDLKADHDYEQRRDRELFG